ncbi:MAG: YidC/Oxa1 family membrane protein insertase [Treponemataceae bacterium]|nr:MAG: YidC/Oxa1 family membrane protein insertase [Treponemataceae bacterium]
MSYRGNYPFAALVYCKGLPLKETIPLFCLPALFLVLLYNAPSGLVLYWTCNNIFSLIKNSVHKNGVTRRVFFAALAVFSVLIAVYVVFMHKGALHKRVIISCAALAPTVIIILKMFRVPVKSLPVILEATKNTRGVYTAACAALALFAGFALPSRVIASSASEFYIPQLGISPLPLVGTAFLEALGFFAWLMLVFALCGAKYRPFLAALMSAVFCGALANTYIFARDYGFMTPDLHLAGFHAAPLPALALNIIFLCAVFFAVVFIFAKRREALLARAAAVCAAVFVVLGCANSVQIMKYKPGADRAPALPQNEKIYTLSKTGKNVLVIMLDRAVSGYVPYIFAEKPELHAAFAGWTYYPNCTAFGGYTIYSAPAIFGGYEYTPLEIQKRASQLFLDKYYESMRVMPVLLAQNGFEVTVSDQPQMDNSLYSSWQHISSKDIRGRYTDFYLASHPDANNIMDYNAILRKNLLRFSFFNFSPLALRNFVYDSGYYLAVFLQNSSLQITALENYSALYYLPQITAVTEDNTNYAAVMVNELTHSPSFLQAPDYVPVSPVTDKGGGPFAGEDHYHVNMASFLLLGKWFNYLKEQGVYDNTKIIIVSDHGIGINSPFPGNITLPNGKCLELYASLLMVKDFAARGPLRADSAFMTCADTLSLLEDGVFARAENPFTGKPLSVQKDGGVAVATVTRFSAALRFALENQQKYRFDIKPDEWLRVHDNIFEPSNWSAARVEE